MRHRRRTMCVISLAILAVYLITNQAIYGFTFKKSLDGDHIPIGNNTIPLTFSDAHMTLQTTFPNMTKSTPLDMELPFNNFSYPLDVDMVKLVRDYKRIGNVQHRVINNFTQRYLHNPASRSTEGEDTNHTEDVFLLFVVKSKSNHWEQRNVIRETWGNEHYLTNFSIKTIFILGTPVNESLNPIKSEIKQFNDIILMDFHDTYFNNTLKTSTAFNWVPEFYPRACFVVLVDDDIYVSLRTLVLFLDQLPSSKRVQLYMGRTFLDVKPHRRTNSKWYVPLSEYPWDSYPPFVPAGTVIMTMDFVSDVRTAMRYTKPFRLDDIYLGILAYRLGVAPVTNENVYEYRVSPRNKAFSSVLTSHGFTPRLLKLTWKTSMSVKHNEIKT